MEKLIYLIPLIPFLGFVFTGIVGSKLPKKLVGTIATSAVLSSFLLSLLCFNDLISTDKQFINQHLFTWFKVNDLQVTFNFTVDHLSIVMMMIITGIGTLIHLYSMGYMAHDKGYYKFFAYLNLFIFSMLLLVMGSNLLILFIGWEGVGLCSFLLIGFWYQNKEYTYAARKAFIMNRIGDLGLLIGIFILAYYTGSIQFNEINSFVQQNFSLNDPILIAATLFLFIGAMGKSAQIPLYTWLPDAMAGPTPVSALIHAATMVTAGIYMIVRLNGLFDLTPFTQNFILWIGLITSIVAAFIGLRQNDIKKVLAYSTVSQLGFMFIALGMGAYTTAMFHLLTHAFFKALLFLAAGSVIHAMSNEQDMRYMGGLKGKLKSTYIVFLIGTLAICGIFPLSGMFSKDEILLEAFVHNKLVFGLTLFSAALTAIYMFRLLFVTFFGKFRGTKEQEKHLHESPNTMLIPLYILAFLSIVGGALNLPHYMGEISGKLSHWLRPLFVKSNLLEVSFATELFVTLITIGIVLLIAFLTYQKYVTKDSKVVETDKLIGWEKLSAHKLYIDELYNTIIVNPIMKLSELANRFDNRILDKGVETFGSLFSQSGSFIGRIQNGSLEVYLFAMSIGVIILLIMSFII